MELTSKTVELRKLTASEGMYLTQADESLAERAYAKTVYLGQGEKVENWREATDEERKDYETERKRRVEEAHRRALEGIPEAEGVTE